MSKTSRLNRLIGSLKMAVLLLVAIAAVLAWGTIYEVRYGTASVQRFIYQSWWFQLLLTFLGINLAVAAFSRMPWRRQHAPFLLAHLGIILILTGGVIGARFGIDGQLVIPEGQAERVLLLPNKVLAIEQPNPGVQRIIPTRFESQAWVQQPNLTVPVMLESGDRFVLTVDRYYPDASFDEDISEGGESGPAALMQLSAEDGQEDEVWLFSQDPERFGVGWADAHVLFLDLPTPEDAKPFLEPPDEAAAGGRGRLVITLPNRPQPVVVPVPDTFAADLVPVGDTPYAIRFKEYFPDFAVTPEGPVSQSDQPNNPALALLLSGPEGQDAHLVFARHPDIGSMHGWAKQINAQVRYEHASASLLPPNAMAVLRMNDGLAGVFTGSGGSRQVIKPLAPGETYTHPELGYRLRVARYLPNAHRHVQVSNRTQEVRAEALHVVLMPLGKDAPAQTAWLTPGEPLELQLKGNHTIRLTYGPEQRELPFTVKLLDFRKIDYPGINMAAAFESDVQLTDMGRGLILMRTIKMNKPLKHRGYSLFQSSFIPGPVETTVLSVRNDPGTPLVYAGFLTVIAGVVAMFIMRRSAGSRAARVEGS